MDAVKDAIITIFHNDLCPNPPIKDDRCGISGFNIFVFNLPDNVSLFLLFAFASTVILAFLVRQVPSDLRLLIFLFVTF